MNKKAVAVLLAGVMVAGTLAGCKSSSSSSSGTDTTSSSAATKTSEKSSSAPEWKDYDKLINEIYTDTDLEDREAKMHEAEDMLMDTGAVIPLYYYNSAYLKKPGIEGDYCTVFGTRYFMYTKKDGQNMDVLKVNLASEPDHLDPALNSTVDGAALASNSFVGLYTTNAEGKNVPALADGDPQVTSNDDGSQSYTIKMKTGLKWSDGSALNANDIVYSWKRAADPDTASDYAYLFTVFKGYTDDKGNVVGDIDVAAPDENTVTFTLNAPCPYIMNLLAFPVFMPVKQSEVEGAEDYKANPGKWAEDAGFVSNGAFTLKSWKHNESMTYVKNPNYYDAANVTVDEIQFMLSADDTAILAAYKAGNLDFAATIPVDEINTLKKTDDFHVDDQLGTYYVGFNVNSELFDGKTAEQAADMRKAFNYLIDRQYIIDTVGQTKQEPATTFIPAKMSDGHGGEFKANDDAYTYPDKDAAGYYPVKPDIDKAIELLKKAGYEFDGQTLSAETPIEINYLTNEGTGHEGIAQCIQQDLAQIGITMNISTEDWQTFLNDRKSGNFDVAREGWLADYDDPVNMLEMFLSNSGNNDMQLGK